MNITKAVKVIRAVSAVLSEKDKSPMIKWIEINTDSKREYKEYSIPKKIWIYWDSITPPSIVDLCVHQASKVCADYEVTLLNPSNLNEYISLPEISSDIPASNKADLIRLMLIEQYGGIWMDASIFLTEDLEWITSKLDRHESFLFYSDECTKDTRRPISENWFIAAPIGSDFIKNWKEEFLSCITSKKPKLFYNDMEDRDYHLQGLTKPDYLLCYISAIVVLNRKKYNILYASSGSTGHYLNYKHKWNGIAIAAELLLRNKKNIAITKLIKLNSSSRRSVQKFIDMKIIRKNSILGFHLKNK
ncbi:glycosyltransferase family 32 protein [Klebsiella quasipneumoniae]